MRSPPTSALPFGGPGALTRADAVRLFEEVTVLAYRADLEPATWDAAPLDALGIRPRGTRAYAEDVVRAAAA